MVIFTLRITKNKVSNHRQEKNMKIKEHRCPWCGSITDPLRLRTEMMKKCCNCGNKYTYHKDGFIGKVYNVLWILTCACGLLAMVNICIAMIIVCLLLIITFSTYNFMSYERVNDNKNFTYKKYKAKLEFTKNELNYIKRRYFLQDKSIIPICFVNDEKKCYFAYDLYMYRKYTKSN